MMSILEKIVRGKEKKRTRCSWNDIYRWRIKFDSFFGIARKWREMKNILNLYYKGIKNEENKIAYKAKFF